MKTIQFFSHVLERQGNALKVQEISRQLLIHKDLPPPPSNFSLDYYITLSLIEREKYIPQVTRSFKKRDVIFQNYDHQWLMVSVPVHLDEIKTDAIEKQLENALVEVFSKYKWTYRLERLPLR